jgi:hypothetical protein
MPAEIAVQQSQREYMRTPPEGASGVLNLGTENIGEV